MLEAGAQRGRGDRPAPFLSGPPPDGAADRGSRISAMDLRH